MRLSRLLVFLILLQNAYSLDHSQLREGDIIFHQSKSAQSCAVQRATGSPWSHMGLITFIQNRPYVFEAVQPVKVTPLDQWISRGADRKYEVKRIRGRVLTDQECMKLKKAARRYSGKPYDPGFEWSSDKIYCSELVWKIYNDALGIKLAKPTKMKDLNISDPEVRKLLLKRHRGKIPLEEPVITPAALFESPLLETVRPNRIQR